MDSILFGKYKDRFRLTLNPTNRKLGSAKYDCGPPCDWCEVASEAELKLAGLLADRLPPTAKAVKERRIARQKRLHGIMGPLCLRRAPHWRVYADPTAANASRTPVRQPENA